MLNPWSGAYPNRESIDVYDGSHIFINGRGSGGKAALALKIAIAPSFQDRSDSSKRPTVKIAERILIISFLYPEDYYQRIIDRLHYLHRLEYSGLARTQSPKLHVIHLYPGNYTPRDLFNRVEWDLESAELYGQPFTSAVIDGLHNVFIQFPEIEGHRLFWPQLYASLRSRLLTIITTHTTLTVPQEADGREYRIDDNRSEPLRHVLVQKTDFQIEVNPVPDNDPPQWRSAQVREAR